MIQPFLLLSVLVAGAARVDITPGFPVAMEGYSDPENRMSEGVHDRLYARTIAFQSGSKQLVLVSCDLISFQTYPFFQKYLLAEFNLQPDELFLAGTHTHSGPHLAMNRTYPHPNNYKYMEELRGKLIAVTREALASRTPAKIGVGKGYSPVGVNRRQKMPDGSIRLGRQPDGPVDKEVLVLEVAKEDGGLIASLWAYACHSRSLKSENRLISGDILGIAGQYVETMIGAGFVSAAFAGASGDIDPWYVVPRFDQPGGGIPETELLGKLLGTEVIHVLKSVDRFIPEEEIRTASGFCRLPRRSATGRLVRLTAARIGKIGILGIDLEVFAEIGLAIKASSPFPHTFVITHCNGGGGYLPTAAADSEGGYEVGVSGFAPEAAGMLVNESIRLLQSLGK